MDTKLSNFLGLTSNQLKIIALVAMTCDHVGKELLPQFQILQIIGRFAFPIFAYMVAEGCIHTKSKKKYLVTIMAFSFLCQIVYYIAEKSLYQCVLVTFSISIVLIYGLDFARKNKKIWAYALSILTFVVAIFVCVILPWIVPNTDFAIDYGVFGVLLPVAVYLGKTKKMKLVFMAIALVLLALTMGDIQWFALLTPFVLALYNGKRGTWKIKNLFYIYYPLHLAGIYLIGLVVF